MRLAMLLVLAIVVQAAGNVCLSAGMKEVASFAAVHPAQWQLIALETITQPANVAGALFLLAFSVLFATVLSRSDLSFAMPIVSMEIVINVALAHLVLLERVSPLRWAGVCLVASGVALVSLSAKRQRVPQASAKERPSP
jgi:drug/metabolite transporter (DMT)-like permease